MRPAHSVSISLPPTVVFTYTLVVDFRMLDFQPAWAHDLTLQDEQLERACVRPEYPREVRTRRIVRKLGLCPGIRLTPGS